MDTQPGSGQGGSTTVEPHDPPTPRGGPVARAWERMFAAFYDPLLRGSEEAGNAERRASLLSQAEGTVVELGSGTGLNLEHYPDGVELLLTEPAEPMARRLEERLRQGGRHGRVLRAGGESLPLRDASVDTVVSTLVLCTVEDPSRTLAEAYRVLRPGGRLLFIEHVAAEEGTGTRRLQGAVHRPWRAFACGCNTNRGTAAAIRSAGFEIGRLERGELEKAPPHVRPLIWGTARKPGA